MKGCRDRAVRDAIDWTPGTSRARYYKYGAKHLAHKIMRRIIKLECREIHA